MIVTLLSSYSCEMYFRICFSVIFMISYEYINTYLKKQLYILILLGNFLALNMLRMSIVS
jgi:hypothetical protein